MKHDFETLVNRSDKYSKKWKERDEHSSNVDKNIPPFSVADFDFKPPAKLIEQLKDYIDTMVFGYTGPGDGYYNSFISWMLRRHDFKISREWILDDNGVVSSITNSIKAFTNENNGIIIMTPVYPPFSKRVTVNNRKVVECQLINTDGYYTIDFDLLEKQCADDNNKMLILCSPHNPVGRIWTKDELLQISRICNKHGVIVVSDEIHMDLETKGYKHIPYGAVSEAALDNSILLTSAGKSFNLAGTRNSMVVIKNEAIRKAYHDYAEANCHIRPNAFGFKMCEIAYSECEDWLDELLILVESNYKLVANYINLNHKVIKVTPLEGTYLVWLNMQGLEMTDDEIFNFLNDECQIFVTRGDIFGDSGKGFVRWNIATPTWVIKDALKRLTKGLEKLGY